MATPLDEYRIYFDMTLLLAKTLAIKSEDAATLMNAGIAEQYGASYIDRNDPYSWKYYLNLAGEYHPLDRAMVVTSLDTLETIGFTKDNLSNHTATAIAYQYGSRYYQALVQAYPDQENLILGILYPADLHYAVNAQNGAILSYPAELVEPHEATLIYELEGWIQRYFARWHVRAFIHSDTLYASAQWASMVLQLVPTLMNLRLKRCKTAEAHSFHIKQFLACRGRLDKYWDYYTLEQALYLYRNIDSLKHNVGQQTTLMELIEHLLSRRYIPIADYTMNQLTIFDQSLYPDYHFRKHPINGSYNMPRKDTFTLAEILKREAKLAPGNKVVSIEEYSAIDLAFKTSISGVVQTKDLESSLIDYTDAVPYKLTDVLLNHWLYFISQDRYPVIVNFRDPVTGEQRSLSSRAAYIYLVYLTYKQYGLDLAKVPKLQANHVFRWPSPSLDDLLIGIEHRRLPVAQVAALLRTIPRLRSFYAKTAFYQWGVAAFNLEQQYWYTVSRIEDQTVRAFYARIIEQLHCDPLIELPESGMEYTEWLKSQHLPEAHYTSTEIQLLIQTVFTAGTGYRFDPTKSAANIQKAMLAVMAQLTSYSIQTIAQVNEKPVRLVEWASLRVGDIHTRVTSALSLKYGTHPLTISTQISANMHLKHELLPLTLSRNRKLARVSIPIEHTLKAAYQTSRQHHLALPRLHLNLDDMSNSQIAPAQLDYWLHHPSTL